ncbi:MAG TPA: non-ribosomal peptide synthetase, partial [Thermoanaerobaculia bacterium]|nr:non-ribosomal peptide synthetase [Thermoanaerobaculia bacterium]
TEHGALANLIAWHVRAFDVTSSDRATHLASFSFDGSIWEIWPYLAAGATVDLVPEDALGSAGRLQSWLANAGTTISFLPTALCVPLLPALEEGAPGALRMLLTGGDRLPRGPREGAPFQLVNNYGPTENGVVATWCAVPPGPAAPPIGRPVDNTEVQVLDARGQLVPPGVAGELYLGGNSLARGYLHRPELDAERFVVRNGRRFYRTGDMVRWSHDGQVEFLGRADTQVKVRCFRVELGEIEAAIASISGVRECVVDVRGEEHEKRIVAWLSGSVDGTAVRATLQQRLPEFMVPSSVIVLEAMPLTRNGKIDRKALVEHAAPAQPAAVEHIPPRTELERIIATAWQEALGVERIGIHDNFFDLGGHSLLLIRVSTILSRTLDRDLSAINLFDHTTVASLAAHLSETAPVRPAAAEPTLAAADRREAMQRQRQRRMESRA